MAVVVIFFDGGWDEHGNALPIVRFGNKGSLARQIKIGRGQDCEVRFESQVRISRLPKFVELTIMEDGVITVMDLFTTNGVSIRGQVIELGTRMPIDIWDPQLNLQIAGYPVIFTPPNPDVPDVWTAHIVVRLSTDAERAQARALEAGGGGHPTHGVPQTLNNGAARAAAQLRQLKLIRAQLAPPAQGADEPENSQ